MGIAEIDAGRHHEMREALFERLKRERIEPCETCNGNGLLTALSWDEDDPLIPHTITSTCECKIAVLHIVNLFDAGVPQEFWKADEIEAEHNIAQFKLLHTYAKRLAAARKHGLGLVLHGENGTGKSSSASIPIIAALREGMSAAFISWPDLVQGWRRGFKDPALVSHLDERLARDLIVLDEVGKEHVGNNSGDVLARFDSLLRMRRGAFMPTILVTNLDPGDLIARYGESVGSLLTDRFKIVQYEPGDWRSEVGPSWGSLLGDSE